MSKEEFVWRYIVRVDKAHARLALIATLLSGSALTAVATIPGVAETAEAARTVAGLSVAELLALITLASLGLSAFLIRTLIKQWQAGIEALTKISDDLHSRPCFKDAPPKQ